MEADREWRRSASARQEWVLARRQRESARQQAKAGAGGGGLAGGGSRLNDDTASPGRSGAGVAAAASAVAGAAGAAVPRVKGKGVRVVVRDDLSAYHPHLMHQVCAREPLNPAPCTPNPIIATACTRSMLACRARTHACLSGCEGGVRTRPRGSEVALVLALRRVKRRVR